MKFVPLVASSLAARTTIADLLTILGAKSGSGLECLGPQLESLFHKTGTPQRSSGQQSGPDGFTDRHNVFERSRVYNYEADQCTSPDTTPGNLDNPFSYRLYLYDNGNRNSFSDPSGNAPNASNGYCCLINVDANDNDNIIGAFIGALFGFFSGLFGGGHHNAPQPPPQVEPSDPDAYAQITRVANFANPLGAIVFATRICSSQNSAESMRYPQDWVAKLPALQMKLQQ